MTSFLRQVAEYYCHETDLEQFCFVFPNRRSGQFFEHCLTEITSVSSLMPKVMTLTDLLEEAGDKIIVSQIDAIFILYQAYQQIIGDNASGIDHFIYWGNILLNDFNDVDMAMADPATLFTNLSNLRDIATDYIEDDLKREIDRILNIQLDKSEEFWKKTPHLSHDNDDTDAIQRDYYTLWEKLPDIYAVFHNLLNDRGLTTLGHLYRETALRLKDNHQLRPWPYKQIVVVGFAGLTRSEDRIFTELKQRGAHFWWDDCSSVFPNECNSGVELVKSMKNRFPMPAELDNDCSSSPKMDVMGVPTLQGQAKWAMHLIDTMGKKSSGSPIDDKLQHLPAINMQNAINTAIVLPDEQLFVPIITSVPENVQTLNVTLGYSMRNASISTLMHLIARVHHQATLNKTTGRWMYFRDSVMDILSHPMLKSAFTSDIINITAAIESSSEYNIGEDLFYDTALQDLFTTVHDLRDKIEVLAFIDRIARFAMTIDVRVRKTDSKTLPDDRLLPLQSAFIQQFIASLEQLRRVLAQAQHLPTEDTTIFYLIDRVTTGITIPFTGEPLEGLQVMGILETRCLDFDNLIIPSMNEHVYPSRRSMSTMIPNILREAFALPTNAFVEAVNTYYFYRMISRARYVAFIYDNSSQSYGSGEPSRFINQLEKIYHRPLHKFAIDTHIKISQGVKISVPKRSGMMSAYTTRSEHPKPLSASAINGYIDCPLKFYFQRVQGLDGDLPGGDIMDAATFGTIVHDSLQSFYFPDVNGRPRTEPYVVTANMILDFKKSRLTSTIVKEINKTYLHRPEQEWNEPIFGDAIILQETLETYVKNALDYDLQLIAEHGNITILECEVEHLVELDISGLRFNFSFKIDRFDRIGDSLRIIDYKTGGDQTAFSSIEDMTDSNKDKRRHAILQLLLYCNAYCQLEKKPLTITPIIYKLRDMDEAGIIKKGKTTQQYVFQLDDKVNTQFLQEMKVIIEGMLDENQPFTQTENIKNCEYCRFTDFCRR